MVKVTIRKSTICKAQRLAEIIVERRKLEKEEKELKDFFKREIGDNEGLKAGNVQIIRQEKSRTDLDKNALKDKLGNDFLKGFEKVTQYFQLNVLTLS
ncbi:MAG: hypothetical protein GTO02_15150 [Candidatus Dadabacteria bacterium]|nr:hypothetical protein [Candidatus Dadabacteria bacterium]